MTAPHPGLSGTSPDVEAEVAREQAHVDRVYDELAKATRRAADVEADGLARGRTDRTGDVRDEEMTGLFERDALVYAAARRRAMIDTQYEGLVFGRLDLGAEETPAAERDVRYIGRLGVRDDDYEPLVVDWRAPAASAFYRATPVDPMGVIRRRVLRCRGPRVVGVEDDLMVPEAPDDLVVVGDGALMAALTRSRGRQIWSDQLKDMLGARKIAQPVDAHIAQIRASGQFIADELPGCARERLHRSRPPLG